MADKGPKRGTVNNPKGRNQYTGKARPKSLTQRLKEKAAHAIDDTLGKTTVLSTARVIGDSSTRVEVRRTNPGSALLGVKPKRTAQSEARIEAQREIVRTAPVRRVEAAALTINNNIDNANNMALNARNNASRARQASSKSKALRQAARETGMLGRIVGLDDRRNAAAAAEARKAKGFAKASVGYAKSSGLYAKAAENDSKTIQSNLSRALTVDSTAVRNALQPPMAPVYVGDTDAVRGSNRSLFKNRDALARDISSALDKGTEAALDIEDAVRQEMGIAPRSRMRRIRRNIEGMFD